MGRNEKWLVTTETIAIGIKGNRHSLCGAFKRFQHHGPQWNGPLTLKERCARYVALMKNEQLKCFILGYLSADLFQYVTKDLFDLRRYEFTMNYPQPLYMCQECTMDSYEKPSDDCGCPQMYNVIRELNKQFFKEVDDEDEIKAFALAYKIPNDEQDHTRELDDPTPFFLYLKPVQHSTDYEPYGIYQKYNRLNGRISAENKLLFVDAMRFIGAFESKYEEPELISYGRREFPL